MFDIAKYELQRFKENMAARQAYSQGRDLMLRSGFFDFLRKFCRPYAINGGANPYQSAYAAAFQEGYAKAIDDIVYFEEQYCSELPKAKQLKPEFGALAIARARGDIRDGDV